MDPKEKSISLPLVILFVLVAAVAFAALGYWEGKKTTETTTTDDTVPMPPVPGEPTESVTATTSTTADVTADWKTYTNDTYGFSFKYPSIWNLEEGPSQTDPRRIIAVKSNEPNKNKVWPGSTTTNYYYDQMIVNKETESSISDWIKSRLAGGVTDNSKMVSINGSEFTEIVPGSDPDYLAELKINDGTLFSIIFDWANGRSDITTTQEQILSTFQFTK